MEELPSKKRRMVGRDLFGSVTIAGGRFRKETDLIGESFVENTPCMGSILARSHFEFQRGRA